MEPEIGMGATLQYPSDSYPFTIIRILSPKRIVVQEDRATLVEGSTMSEHQVYEYERNPDAPEVTLSLRKDGLWREVGDSMRAGFYSIGSRRAYRSPNL